LPRSTLLTESDVAGAAHVLDGASVVLVQLQQPATTALAVARRARAAGARVLLDGAPDDDRQRDALLAAADIVRADEREAQALTGTRVLDRATSLPEGRDLLRRGQSWVALAVSSEGTAFVWPDGEALIPLVDTPGVDTPGAGDALVAGLAAALLRGEK